MSEDKPVKRDGLDANLAAYEAAERAAAAAFQTVFEAQVSTYRAAMEAAEAQISPRAGDGFADLSSAVHAEAMGAAADWSRALTEAARTARDSLAAATPNGAQGRSGD